MSTPSNQWISVKERLPRVRREVQVFTKTQFLGYGRMNFTWDKKSKYWSGNNQRGHFFCGKDEVTHWATLPEHPQTES